MIYFEKYDIITREGDDMNIYDYFDHYKDFSFEEEPFNEVDAMIFSFLTYATYNGVLLSDSKMTLQKVANLHLEGS